MATKNFKEKISHIKAFAFDCDGVLTDGGLLMLENGEMLRKYDSKDGYAITEAIKKGYPVAIISGGNGTSMNLRFKKLGITNVYLAAENKVDCLNDFCSKNNILPQDVLYMGDDMPDIPVMKLVGLAVAPSDAVLEVKAIAHHTSAYNGGKGCVRDTIEQVMKSKNEWDWK